MLRKGPWIGVVSAVALTIITLLALLAPLLPLPPPNEASLQQRLLPPGSEGHLLGTDALGRDVLSRLVFGGRISILIALSTVTLSSLIGVIVGLIAGFFGGWIDRILMRLIDVQLSFPFIVLAITIAAILGSSVRNIVTTLVITSWVLYARLARGEALKLNEVPFVEATSALGASSIRIMLRHLLPNLVPMIVVMASLEVGRIIIAEAGISFLGFGIQPPTPAWGNMISDGRDYMFNAWWLVVFPGIFISVAVLAANLAGDWVREVLDPRAGRR